jgi:uncharacterized protein (DUF2249 family)
VNPIRVLDLREIPPGERHRAIVEAFGGLRPAESLVVVTDHYPAKLPRVLRAAFPEGHEIAFLKDGPPEWWIQLGRVDGASGDGMGEAADV